jgi:hypothetical protein
MIRGVEIVLQGEIGFHHHQKKKKKEIRVCYEYGCVFHPLRPSSMPNVAIQQKGLTMNETKHSQATPSTRRRSLVLSPFPAQLESTV